MVADCLEHPFGAFVEKVSPVMASESHLTSRQYQENRIGGANLLALWGEGVQNIILGDPLY